MVSGASRDLWLLVIAVVVALLDLRDRGLGAQDHACLRDRAWWATVCALALPYLSYAFVWHRTDDFQALVQRVAPGVGYVKAFATMAHALKVVQLAAVLLFFRAFDSAPRVPAAAAAADAGYGAAAHLAALPPRTLVLSAVLLAVGQALNAGVYLAIGETGVYYGFKLGHAVEWVHGFPFNLRLRHPQYLGACLTYWALLLLAASPTAVRDGAVHMVAALCGMYVAVSRMEEGGGEDQEQETRHASKKAK